MFINRQLGEYILLRRLAVGGQSEVFLALKEGPGDFSRPLVIKALPTRHRDDARYNELFYREAFLSVRFAHPHVMTVHDMRVMRQEHCMIMDFIAGQTVSDIAQRGFKAGTPLPINHVVQIIADAADGLNYVHQFRDLDDSVYSIVHRDVSPQNLMVTYQGVTKIFDFGIARIREAEDEDGSAGGGKYAYMSPEQCRDEPADARSDIFSLGIILYELTCGRRLFRRATTPEVIKAVTEEPIPAPGLVVQGFPEALEAIIMRALERDPAERYANAAEMRDELIDFLSTRADASLRRALGCYVAELFVAEREDIAETMRDAYAKTQKPKPIGDIPLEMLGHIEGDAADGTLDEDLSDPTLELPREGFGRAPEKPSKREIAPADRSTIIEAKKKNSNLAAEVRRLQKRQSILMSLLFIVISAASVFVFFQFQSNRTVQAETPVEIGDKR
ncbi:serine/threonine-protein kinase [Bradymonas sediminis]|uniref:Uncharacterized protein n=1 Tax=Bradymonas sediminis TaxID=1548548 RepID=A0A2Z4FKC5_9DELT|nr:serine/threonine-protein kinase [Bradymonas sediminis]AWV89176.1 hypothetical protein DN745_07420 [Bradymonas sediminis]TDP64357.1 serine/threonine protein kinase [Bradymonas sediminis]